MCGQKNTSSSLKISISICPWWRWRISPIIHSQVANPFLRARIHCYRDQTVTASSWERIVLGIWGKLLLLNEEDQSSDPKHSYKKLGGHHGHLQSQYSGARIRDPGASLPKSVTSGCKGDPDSDCNMREIEDNTRHQPLNPKCASTQVHAYYTYAPNTCRPTSTTYTKEDCFSLLH